MDDYVEAAISHQLHTLAFIALLLGLGKGGVPGLATVATAASVLTAPTHLVGGLWTHLCSIINGTHTLCCGYTCRVFTSGWASLVNDMAITTHIFGRHDTWTIC